MADAPGRQPCCVCDEPGGKQCTKCKSRHYCSKACQLVDWKGGHNKACSQMASAFQDRLLDELMPLKVKIKEEPPIVADFVSADGSTAAARLPAVGPTAVVKSSALNGDVQSWRGTCAICLDLLPIDGTGSRQFYSCCTKLLCTGCTYKCLEHSDKSPLCRTSAPRSVAEVIKNLRRHVAKGNAEAANALGEAYKQGQYGLVQGFNKQFSLFMLAAKQGHAQGQFAVGRCYQYGEGVEIDHFTAATWWRLATDQGFPPAESNLAMCYFQGEGIEQSHDVAVKWWRRAAAQGNMNAMCNLGMCLSKGHGVEEDYAEAMRSYKRTEAKGDKSATPAIRQLAGKIARRARNA